MNTEHPTTQSVWLRVGSLICTVTCTDIAHAKALATHFGTALLQGPPPSSTNVDLHIAFGKRTSVKPVVNDTLVIERTPNSKTIYTEFLEAELHSASAPQQLHMRVGGGEPSPYELCVHISIVMNKVLFLMDRLVLHAAAIRWGDHAHLFIGDKGCGKSTLSIQLAKAGGTVLAEDHTLLSRTSGALVVSGCDETSRLTRKTEQHFFADGVNGQTDLRSGEPKKVFERCTIFSSKPYVDVPAGAIFFPHVGEQFDITPLSGHEALLRLIQGTHKLYRFSDKADYASYIDYLTALLQDRRAFALELSPQLQDLQRLPSALNALDASAKGDGHHTHVHFVGSLAHIESYSMVNDHWKHHLGAKGYKVTCDDDVDTATPDVVVYHNYEYDFKDFKRPPAKRCVAMRTSDFGPHPPAWTQKIKEEFDELWVYTEWMREMAVAGGVPPDKVRVLKLGMAPNIFTPKGKPYELPVRARRTFLFAGGAVVRKGMDLILKAYKQAFAGDADVCLVIKDHRQNNFYRERSLYDDIIAAQQDPDVAPIVYVDDHLTIEDLASLFRSCDVGVFPYRAEGFCLPILEAMACGTPCMVPHFGACLDFCDERTSLLMPIVRMQLPVFKRFKLNLGFTDFYEEVDFCEVPVDVLAEYFVRAYHLPDEQLAAMAEAGVKRAHEEFTWSQSAAVLEQYIGDVCAKPDRATVSV